MHERKRTGLEGGQVSAGGAPGGAIPAHETALKQTEPITSAAGASGLRVPLHSSPYVIKVRAAVTTALPEGETPVYAAINEAPPQPASRAAFPDKPKPGSDANARDQAQPGDEERDGGTARELEMREPAQLANAGGDGPGDAGRLTLEGGEGDERLPRSAVVDMVLASGVNADELIGETTEETKARIREALLPILQNITVNREEVGAGNRFLVNELTDHPDVVIKRMRSGAHISMGITRDELWAVTQAEHRIAEKYFDRMIPNTHFLIVDGNDFGDPKNQYGIFRGPQYIMVQDKIPGKKLDSFNLQNYAYHIPEVSPELKSEVITFINSFEKMAREEGLALDNEFIVDFSTGQVRLSDTNHFMSFQQRTDEVRKYYPAAITGPDGESLPINTPDDIAKLLLDKIPAFANLRDTNPSNLVVACDSSSFFYRSAEKYLAKHYEDKSAETLGLLRLADLLTDFPHEGGHSIFIQAVMRKFGITYEELTASTAGDEAEEPETGNGYIQSEELKANKARQLRERIFAEGATIEENSLSDRILTAAYPMLQGIMSDDSKYVDYGLLIHSQLRDIDETLPETVAGSEIDPRLQEIVDAARLNGELVLYKLMQNDTRVGKLNIQLGLLKELRRNYGIETVELVSEIRTTAQTMADAYTRENEGSGKEAGSKVYMWNKVLELITEYNLDQPLEISILTESNGVPEQVSPEAVSSSDILLEQGEPAQITDAESSLSERDKLLVYVKDGFQLTEQGDHFLLTDAHGQEQATIHIRLGAVQYSPIHGRPTLVDLNDELTVQTTEDDVTSFPFDIVQLATDIVQSKEISLPTTILESDGQLSENPNIRLRDMLVKYVNQTDYKPPVGRQTVVLDLACGRCNEAVTLNEFFGIGRSIRLVGVDINRQDIGFATSKYKIRDLTIGSSMMDSDMQGSAMIDASMYPQSEFYARDARNLAAIPQVPEKADVVIIRNQNIGVNEEVWAEIFNQGLGRLDDGIMIITSLTEEEHPKAVKALKKLDCEFVVNEPNQFTRPHNDLGDALDKNIIIVKRKKKQPVE